MLYQLMCPRRFYCPKRDAAIEADKTNGIENGTGPHVLPLCPSIYLSKHVMLYIADRLHDDDTHWYTIAASARSEKPFESECRAMSCVCLCDSDAVFFFSTVFLVFIRTDGHSASDTTNNVIFFHLCVRVNALISIDWHTHQIHRVTDSIYRKNHCHMNKMVRVGSKLRSRCVAYIYYKSPMSEISIKRRPK